MKQGDKAFTDLPGHRHVPKHHPRILAAGAVDEVSAALGFARAMRPKMKCGGQQLTPSLEDTQRCLIALAAQVAGVDGMGGKIAAAQEELDRACALLEARIKMPGIFILPGANTREAALHLARTACRRAETAVSPLRKCAEAKRYINRLSKYLFLLALLNR